MYLLKEQSLHFVYVFDQFSTQSYNWNRGTHGPHVPKKPKIMGQIEEKLRIS